MTVNELQMLICGIGIGAQTMAVLHMIGDMRDARRSLAESRQARRRAAADHYLNSVRLHRLQQRTGVRR
ncbi:hypothetical protein ACH4F6_39180 [Streptomyces sp. NPDC017936]|uniref:hypothetical protein n=1 Tax=Streptomyces sp. NPDC017936 TaxID=3365016 RepID=UPI0037AC61C5